MNALATLPRDLHRRIMEKRNRLVQSRLSTDILRDLEERMQVELVYNSNSIEGVTLSRGETELAIRGMTVRGKSITDVLAAQNHPRAIELVKELALGNKELSEQDILGIHMAIMSGIISTAGEYRRHDVRIVGAPFTPPPHYQIQEEMKQLVEFINENPAELRPVELAAHTHYYLAWIHPFDDGNGRMARLLMNMILLRNRYPFAIIKKVDRKKYLDTLDAVSCRGDFEPFLIFMARCVEQTLDLYLNAMEKGRSKEKLRTLAELAKGTPYSAEYLSLQARKGVLDAVKVGRMWMSTKKTIETYMKEHGRKGKAS
ncbi:MAG: Fic family protein [Thermoproteota archaeon]